MARGPGVDAVLRGFMALAVDMVRVDPTRRPGPEMRRWCRDLAEEVGLEPIPVDTSRALLEEAMRIARAVQDTGPTTPPARTPRPTAPARR